MIRPPSVQRPSDDYFSGDPAFVQLQDDATEAQIKEHRRRWQSARETGDFAELLEPGKSLGEATKFIMKPIGAEAFASLLDMIQGGLGNNTAALFAFRISLRSVVNFGNVEIERTNHPTLGSLASTDWLDKGGIPAGMALRIVYELGSSAIEKAKQLRPN